MPVFGVEDRLWLDRLTNFRDQAIANDHITACGNDAVDLKEVPDEMREVFDAHNRDAQRIVSEERLRVEKAKSRAAKLFGTEGYGFLDGLNDGTELSKFWVSLRQLLYQRINPFYGYGGPENGIIRDLLARFPERVWLPLIAEVRWPLLDPPKSDPLHEMMNGFLTSPRADFRHLETGSAKPSKESDLPDRVRKALLASGFKKHSMYAAFKGGNGRGNSDTIPDIGQGAPIRGFSNVVDGSQLSDTQLDLIEELFREMVPARSHDAGVVQSEINSNKSETFSAVLQKIMPGKEEGFYLKQALRTVPYGFQRINLAHYPSRMIWPYIASHLDIIDRAVGLAEPFWFDPKFERSKAIELLRLLPKTPERYKSFLVDVATGEAAGGRASAQQLLAGASNTISLVSNRLNDKKAAVREQAARTLLAIGDESALPDLEARSAVESAKRVKAALSDAISALTSNIDKMTLAEILAEQRDDETTELTEATQWVGQLRIPETLTLSDGRSAYAEFTEWLLRIAVRHGSPQGSAFIDQRLMALSPESQSNFAEWVLRQWVSYDTQPWPEERVQEARESALNESYETYRMFWPERETTGDFLDDRYRTEKFVSRDEWAEIDRENIERRANTFMNWQPYLFSAAAAKGLLAIARHTPPETLQAVVHEYLSDHAKRNSQAKALLECVSSAEGGRKFLMDVAKTQRQKSLRVHAEKLHGVL